MKTYNFSDVRTQEAMLRQQLIGQHPSILNRAIKALYKRVMRHNGLNNKYHANGKLRQA